MTTLLMVLGASVATGVLVGMLARMPPRQILGQCLAMCAVATAFWGLVELL